MKVLRMHCHLYNWVQVRLQTLSPGWLSRWQELRLPNLPEAPRIPWLQNHLVEQKRRKRSLRQLGRSLMPLALLIGRRNPHIHVLWPQKLGRSESKLLEQKLSEGAGDVGTSY